MEKVLLLLFIPKRQHISHKNTVKYKRHKIPRLCGRSLPIRAVQLADIPMIQLTTKRPSASTPHVRTTTVVSREYNRINVAGAPSPARIVNHPTRPCLHDVRRVTPTVRAIRPPHRVPWPYRTAPDPRPVVIFSAAEADEGGMRRRRTSKTTVIFNCPRCRSRFAADLQPAACSVANRPSASVNEHVRRSDGPVRSVRYCGNKDNSHRVW